MKKLLSMSVTLMLALAAMPAFATDASTTYIGADAAQTAALSHAKLSDADVAFFGANLEYSHSKWYYEVMFLNGNTMYEYGIDPVSSEVLYTDVDIVEYDLKALVAANSAEVTTEYIGTNSAIDAALKSANITSEKAENLHAYAEYDDGTLVYKVCYYQGTDEYEYEIDARTGKLIDIDNDAEKSERTDSVTSASISDEADDKSDRKSEPSNKESGKKTDTVTSATDKYDKDDDDDHDRDDHDDDDHDDDDHDRDDHDRDDHDDDDHDDDD